MIRTKRTNVPPSNITELKDEDTTSALSTEHRGKLWPTTISCEMNIPKWEDALRKTGLLEEYQDVIDGFTHGFDQGIPEHTITGLTHFTPVNHSSATLVADKITDNLKSEVDKGRMFGPFTHETVAQQFPFFRSNPLGAVVNGDGAIRPINDLSYPRNVPDTPSVNSFVNKRDFDTTWDDFGTVSKYFKSSNDLWLLGVFDWEKAYRQIPTLMTQWKYLLVLDFDGRLYIDTRVTFGGVAGCGTFGRPADAWKDIMTREHDIIKVFRWVDDNLFLKRYGSSTEMKDIVKRSKELGVQTNESKLSSFQHEQKFIGFVWNGMNKTVRLPATKLEERKKQITDFLSCGSISYNQLEVFIGRLTHVSYLLPQLRCYLCGLYRMKKEWQQKRATRVITSDVREDLEFWHSTLMSFKHLRLIALPQPIDIGWVGDASTSYGIGVLVGDAWIQFQLSEQSRKAEPDRQHINYLETVAIRLGLLMVLGLQRKRGRNLVVWTDNTTTQAAITNRKSKNRAVNEEWKIIQALLIENQTDLVAQRVTSKDNRADELSRGLKGDCLESNRFTLVLPCDLAPYFVSSG